MKKIAATLGSLFALWAALSFFPTVAQTPQFPQTLQPNTVVGRLGIGPGPAQAIPFASLFGNLFVSNSVPANVIQNGSLAQMPANTIKGNNTGSLATPIDLTGQQAEGILQFTQSGTGAVQRPLDSWVKTNAIRASDFVTAGTANAQNATTNVTITSGQATLAVSTALFASTDCQTGSGCTGTNGNKVITVGGVGAASAPLQTTIAGFTDSQHITLGTNAGTSQAATSEPIVWGTDNTTALQNWINVCTNLVCFLDGSRYLVTGVLTPPSPQNFVIFGAGRFSSEIIQANVANGILSVTTTTGFANVQLYYFRLSQYMPQTAAVALINLGASTNAQFGSTLVDLMLYGGNNAVFANNLQWFNVDRNTWLNQSNSGLFYEYALACNTGVAKIENSFISPLSGANGLNINAEGGITIINNDITTQGSQTGVAVAVQSSTACSFGDIFVDNNSIENWGTGATFNKGSSTSGGAVHFSGNDFFNNAAALSIGDANATWLNDVAVTGNHLYCVTTCVTVTNSVRNIAITGNTFTNVSGTPTGINISGNAVTGIAKGNTFTGMTTNVSNSSPVFYAESLANGHLKTVGPAPTVGTCTGGAIVAGSTDEAGSITFTNTDTSCSINFAQNYAVAPFCTETISGGAGSGLLATTSTSALSATFGAGASALTWACRGN